jgi:hypothetical protein
MATFTCYPGALDHTQRVEVSTLKNITVSDGACHIIAKKETLMIRAINYEPDDKILDDGRQNLREYDYTSSMIVTTKPFFHGKYEARCKLPKGNGLWPAFWLFGFQGNKRYNEIDIFDAYEGHNTLVNCIYHDFDGSGNQPVAMQLTRATIYRNGILTPATLKPTRFPFSLTIFSYPNIRV